ncbi:MAG: hypothetical protein KGL39_08725 [Patescibacteria group bacterium]|nr:hypothetical protein [Patescibacteria group bacterium]
MSKESNQRPTGMTGVNPATPKSMPSGPLKPASTGPLQKPAGAGSAHRGKQGMG